MIGHPILQYLSPEDAETVGEAIRHELEGGEAEQRMARMLSAQGDYVWIDGIGKRYCNAEGEPIGLIVVGRNVTDRVLAEKILAQSEARFRSLIENAPDLIAVLDEQGMIQYVSPSSMQVLGRRPEELVGLHFSSIVHPDDLPMVLQEFEAVVAHPNELRKSRFRVLTADGSLHYLEAVGHAVPTADGRLEAIINSRDVTDRVQAESRIEFLAHHDSLTGLANRTVLQNYVPTAMAQASRQQQLLALLFLDLDRFKIINDSLGHERGDLLLQEVARRLQASVRASDVVVRLGGDEFAIVQTGFDDPSGSAALAQKIVGVLSEPFLIDGLEVYTSISIGIAIYPNDGTTTRDLVKGADLAMYRAKIEGRDKFQFFSPEMTATFEQRLNLEHGLRQALVHEEFLLCYQPELELATGEIVGLEALLRWQHPARGLLPPAAFINVAEECGLIVPIGRWVLIHACLQAQQWRVESVFPPRASVNISTLQFQREGLVQAVREALEISGLPPERLELEVTESLLMQNVEKAIDIIHDLRELGVHITIDDFGTGYSSLSYLKAFSVDKLKIDQSFTHDLNTDPSDAAIIRAIIGLGHALGMRVLAEGVETEEQMNFLREEGCDEVQGFLISRPVPAGDIAPMLASISRWATVS
jgi:diguanylate cyclase (GGDEF)-like protein/PAS domain S-box-containing protein